MNKKYQVFVSSTYEDLKNERQEIVEAILDAGHIPAGMEIFGGAGTIIDTIKNGLMNRIFIFYCWEESTVQYIVRKISALQNGNIDMQNQLINQFVQ